MSQYPYEIEVFYIKRSRTNKINIKKEIWTRKSYGLLVKGSRSLDFNPETQNISSFFDSHFISIDKAIEHFTKELNRCDFRIRQTKDIGFRIRLQRGTKEIIKTLNALKAYKN